MMDFDTKESIFQESSVLVEKKKTIHIISRNCCLFIKSMRKRLLVDIQESLTILTWLDISLVEAVQYRFVYYGDMGHYVQTDLQV